VVGRSSGEPAYQLAVVVDDAAMGVTQVVRGDDLIDSTPRQILLDRALGFVEPTFAHVPLVVMPDGSRLAKRDGSIKLATLRERGVDPACLREELMSSLGVGQSGVDWSLIPKSPWVVPDGWRG
jgi:glutamyl-tRNA synthetase